MTAMASRRQAASAHRKAPHKPEPVKYLDGATDELRNRVAYAICANVYAGACACQQRKASPCSTMLSAASSAILTIDEARPF